MRVVYDHQIFSTQNYGGVSRYFYELQKYFNDGPDSNSLISQLYSNNTYIKELSRKNNDNIFNKLQYIYNVKYKCKNDYDFNERKSIEFLTMGNYDIFHPTYYNPYFLKYLGYKPFVLTVYDMVHEIFPEYFSLDNSIIKWKKVLIEKAAKVIAISENTKKDIIKIYDTVDEDKITVIYLGNSIDVDVENNHIKNIINNFPDKYILFVGTRNIYKNFYFFIESIVPVLHAEKDVQIVCVGEPFTVAEQKFFKNIGIYDRIYQFSVNDNTLAHIYKNAIALVFPSLYEGFGFPVLEAFGCGCPTILSDSSSLREVGGDAAIYFNPKDPASLKSAITKVICNEGLRDDLKSKGYIQREKFSWDKTRKETMALYESIL